MPLSDSKIAIKTEAMAINNQWEAWIALYLNRTA